MPPTPAELLFWDSCNTTSRTNGPIPELGIQRSVVRCGAQRGIRIAIRSVVCLTIPKAVKSFRLRQSRFRLTSEDRHARTEEACAMARDVAPTADLLQDRHQAPLLYFDVRPASTEVRLWPQRSPIFQDSWMRVRIIEDRSVTNVLGSIARCKLVYSKVAIMWLSRKLCTQ